jgi:hypothetical protein
MSVIGQQGQHYIGASVSCSLLDEPSQEATLVGDILCISAGGSGRPTAVDVATEVVRDRCADGIDVVADEPSGVVVVRDPIDGINLWRVDGLTRPSAWSHGDVVIIVSDGARQPFGPRRYEWLGVYDAESGERLANVPIARHHEFWKIGDGWILANTAGVNGRESLRLIRYRPAP